MFSKLNIYLVLKANFNSKFMFIKLNIQFTEHSVYRTLLYQKVASGASADSGQTQITAITVI